MGQVRVVDIHAFLKTFNLKPSVWCGNTPLFSRFDCESLLAQCKASGTAVLGIEGFTILNDSLSPEMEYIADLSVLASDDEFALKSIEASERFLELARSNDGLLFDFLLAATA